MNASYIFSTIWYFRMIAVFENVMRAMQSGWVRRSSGNMFCCQIPNPKSSVVVVPVNHELAIYNSLGSDFLLDFQSNGLHKIAFPSTRPRQFEVKAYWTACSKFLMRDSQLGFSSLTIIHENWLGQKWTNSCWRINNSMHFKDVKDFGHFFCNLILS